MARRTLFAGIPEFLAVAEHGSFRAAAAQLRVTPAAMSQAVKALEEQLGVPLFLRTTRSVGLTEAGAQFLAQLRPPTAEIRQAIERLGALRGRPSGTLRFTVPRIAVELAIAPVLPEFRRRYPEIGVEIDVEDASVDLSSAGYDAGIRIGEFIERDMIAVKLTPEFRWLVLGAPTYFASRGWPRSPQDLTGHECIRYRFPTARNLYRWEFVEAGRRYSLDPPGQILVNDHLTMNAIAARGLGLAYSADLVVGDDLASGRLVSVLSGYLPTTAGLYLYFPERSREQPKLRAFIDVATRVLARAAPGGRGGPPH
jgi:DNA-binding transcriptional LysR family regulator